MAFDTPATQVAGTILTAGWLNTYVRDNIAWMATDSPACRAYNSVSYQIATAVETVLTFNSERFDNAGVHSTSSNTGRLTVPTGAAGKYLIGGGIEYGNSASGTTRNLNQRLNGATEIAEINGTTPSASAVTRLSILSIYQLAAADYVELTSFQDSGGNLVVNSSANYSPEGYIYWFRT